MTTPTIIPVCAREPYEVVIGRGVLDRVPALLPGADRVAVLHPPVLAAQAEALARTLPGALLLEVPDAEAAKTVDVLARCWDALARAGFTRSDAVVGLGGGATTDLAGLVAASWLRGVRLVTVPTTVLGAVDAAVGGKTGINIAAGKNLVGAFWEPAGVVCDTALLDTLPAEQVAAGLAEVVKCGFIADPEILDLVETDPVAATTLGSPVLTELITRGVRVKAEVVSGDLREATALPGADAGAGVGRELLNYGHTFGHAVERAEGYRWPHGHAVAVGMVYVAELARVLGLADDAFVGRHRRVLASLGLPTRYDATPWPELRAAMALDKKARGSSVRFVVLSDVARPSVVAPDEEAMAAAFAALNRA